MQSPSEYTLVGITRSKGGFLGHPLLVEVRMNKRNDKIAFLVNLFSCISLRHTHFP